MELEKIRNLSDEELKLEEAKAAEQLFRIRFAKSLGKQEGVGKIQVAQARHRTHSRPSPKSARSPQQPPQQRQGSNHGRDHCKDRHPGHHSSC